MRTLALTLMLGLVPGVAMAAGGALESSPLWRVLNFVVFLAVVIYFGRKPVRSFLADRRRGIENDLDAARRELEQAESRLADCRRRMEQVDREMEEMRAAVRDQTEGERRRLLAEAQAAAERIRRDAQAAVQQEVQRARARLRAEVADAAVALAGDLLRDRVGPADRERLLDHFVQRIESDRSGAAPRR